MSINTEAQPRVNSRFRSPRLLLRKCESEDPDRFSHFIPLSRIFHPIALRICHMSVGVLPAAKHGPTRTIEPWSRLNADAPPLVPRATLRGLCSFRWRPRSLIYKVADIPTRQDPPSGERKVACIEN